MAEALAKQWYNTIYLISIFPPTCSLVYLSIILQPANIVPLSLSYSVADPPVVLIVYSPWRNAHANDQIPCRNLTNLLSFPIFLFSNIFLSVNDIYECPAFFMPITIQLPLYYLYIFIPPPFLLLA